ncbi:hypothetical protein CEXT_702301 [Caerostris extrusa]|uniref:CRAL/TRIO N-terminal domain-containing protein n=1 Tax=Caerostris extrusa TaxID=172846 RepID=A0AAV4WEW4_CAEEX|nr:hypothetical protein CEXT_702301 [Caerostris extrusa]
MDIRDPATAKIGEEIFPFEMETVPEYFLKKAEVELFDTPDRRVQGLREIKELVKNDKHTKNIEFEDDFLLQYLRVRKYNVARAFTQLKALVALKKKHPLMFTNFSYDTLVKSAYDKVISMLPWRCQDGCVIVLIELVEDVRRACMLYLFQSLRNPMTQINGYKVIYDLKSNPVRHLKHCTPEHLYLVYHSTQECIAARYKEIHLIIFHKTPETLLNYFPKAALPKQYGGDLQNYDTSEWVKKIMAPENLEALGGRPRQMNV